MFSLHILLGSPSADMTAIDTLWLHLRSWWCGHETPESVAAQARFPFTLQSVLLADQSEKLDSMNLLRLMSPIAATLTLPAVALLEPTAPHVAWRLLLTQPGFAVLLVGNASLAYVVNFTNFQVTHYTSALTLQVCTLLWLNSMYHPYHVSKLRRLRSCSVVYIPLQSPL